MHRTRFLGVVVDVPGRDAGSSLAPRPAASGVRPRRGLAPGGGHVALPGSTDLAAPARERA